MASDDKVRDIPEETRDRAYSPEGGVSPPVDAASEPMSEAENRRVGESELGFKAYPQPVTTPEPEPKSSGSSNSKITTITLIFAFIAVAALFIFFGGGGTTTDVSKSTMPSATIPKQTTTTIDQVYAASTTSQPPKSVPTTITTISSTSTTTDTPVIKINPTCQDTDGGVNPTQNGTVYGWGLDGFPYNLTDSCITSVLTMEYHCQGQSHTQTRIYCDACSEGSCENVITSESCLELSGKPQMDCMQKLSLQTLDYSVCEVLDEPKRSECIRNHIRTFPHTCQQFNDTPLKSYACHLDLELFVDNSFCKSLSDEHPYYLKSVCQQNFVLAYETGLRDDYPPFNDKTDEDLLLYCRAAWELGDDLCGPSADYTDKSWAKMMCENCKDKNPKEIIPKQVGGNTTSQNPQYNILR